MADILFYVFGALIVVAYFGWMYLSTRPFPAGPDMSFNAIEARKDAEAARLAQALEPIVQRAVNEAVRRAFESRRPDSYWPHTRPPGDLAFAFEQ